MTPDATHMGESFGDSLPTQRGFQASRPLSRVPEPPIR